MAKVLDSWFEIESTTFDGKRLAVHVKRIGTSPLGIRFSALVTCNTDDGVMQRDELLDGYWPPPDAELFVASSRVSRKSRPTLPLFLSPDGNVDVSGLQVVVTSTGEPLTAVLDASTAETGPAQWIPFEAPIRLDTPRDKLGREWAHFTGAREDLQRVSVDLLDGDAKACIPDPPDIRVTLGASSFGVELVQYVSGDRREIVSNTDRLRGVISKMARFKLSHLRNQLVLVGFGTPKGLPPRDLAPDDFDDLMKQLGGKQTKAVAYSDRADLRDGYMVKITNVPRGNESIGLFPLPTAPRSPIGKTHGFDVAVSHSLFKPRRDVERELATLINEKDKPGNDVLLISAGAPSFGSCLISDEHLVAPQMLEFMTFPRPKHLKHVLLHRWTNRDVYELTPQLRCVCPPVRHPSEGGVCMVTPRPISEDTWRSRCACGKDTPFRECHGTS